MCIINASLEGQTEILDNKQAPSDRVLATKFCHKCKHDFNLASVGTDALTGSNIKKV